MKIAILQSEDWIGMYINGELVCENHTLSVSDVLDALKTHIPELDEVIYHYNDSLVEENGGLCPKKYPG